MTKYQKVNSEDDANNVPLHHPDISPSPSQQPSHPMSVDPLTDHNEHDDDHPSTEYHRLLPTENNPAPCSSSPPPPHAQTPTHTPTHTVRTQTTTDGVFSNIAAKPDTESAKDDDLPPSYEAAAQDATPPYDYETTVFAPDSDEILVEGMPVGNLFSFLWNMLISVSFQFVGFMLTYLLHTTHAAKNGSRAGLGLTLIQVGFLLRTRPLPTDDYLADSNATPVDPTTAGLDDGSSAAMDLPMNATIAYIMIAVGWFVVIRAVTSYIQALKMERIIQTRPGEGEDVV
ncbi:uncharacterized protein VTP21DRAFT_6830 [Calcarisporiella thermophila]|uniref:uncharacterized protein n=1 Tax=Calcarisporiella thermophila TaxID=911321 RepID=UPI003742A501